MKHPYLQMATPSTRIAGEGKPYRVSPEDRAGNSISMLRTKGRRLARHPGQRATLRSNIDWPLRYARFLRRTGYVPPEPITSEVLSTSSVRVRTRTGRIRSVLPTWTAPFEIRLNVFIKTAHAPLRGRLTHWDGRFLPSPFGGGLNQYQGAAPDEPRRDIRLDSSVRARGSRVSARSLARQKQFADVHEPEVSRMRRKEK